MNHLCLPFPFLLWWLRMSLSIHLPFLVYCYILIISTWQMVYECFLGLSILLEGEVYRDRVTVARVRYYNAIWSIEMQSFELGFSYVELGFLFLFYFGNLTNWWKAFFCFGECHLLYVKLGQAKGLPLKAGSGF